LFVFSFSAHTATLQRLAKVKIVYAATVDDLLLCLFRVHCHKPLPTVVAIDCVEQFAAVRRSSF
jgi:hypothetical protein